MEACEEGEDKTEGRLKIQSLALNSISALLVVESCPVRFTLMIRGVLISQSARPPGWL